MQVKVGFGISGLVGTGVVIMKTKDGKWSGPSCIGTPQYK
jgi:lipid-binding SYLF domain-containing protein